MIDPALILMVGKNGMLPEGAPNSKGPILRPFPAIPLLTLIPPIFVPPNDGKDDESEEDADDEGDE